MTTSRRNKNDDFYPLRNNNNHGYSTNNNKSSKVLAGPSLDSVRMNSLLDKETNLRNDSSNASKETNLKHSIQETKEEESTTMHHREQSTSMDPTSFLSPSSMEVTFSDPQKYDHSSFSKRQSTTIDTIITNSSHNINYSPLGTSMDNTNDGDDIEEKFRDEYIRSGTHFRSLLDQAFHKVANTFSNYDRLERINEDSSDIRGDSSLEVFQNGVHENQNNCRKKRLGKRSLAQDAENEGVSNRPCRRRKSSSSCSESDDEIDSGSNKLTAQLARQKMSEVLSLKRALKEAEEHANAMSHANATLRESSATSAARINTLTESLRITSSKVAESRADADMARAKVTSLSSQLKSLKSALDETKQVCDSIRVEHDDIQNSARTLEAKLVQTESELERVDKEKFEMKLERDDIRQELQDYCQTAKQLRIKLEKKEDELQKLNKHLSERNDIEQARKERLSRLENELRDSRTMLVEVTSAAKDAESTNANLQNTIQHLQRENKSLHDKIEEVMDSSMREKSKLQEALTEAESESQKLRMKSTIDEEALQRERLDKTASEKEITNLKARIADLEGRLQDTIILSSGVISPNDSNTVHSQSETTISSHETPGKHTSTPNSAGGSGELKLCEKHAIQSSLGKDSMGIPPLRPVTPKTGFNSSQSCKVQGKENYRVPNANKIEKHSFKGGISGSKFSTVKCSICFKSAYGIMKSCQCGNVDCDKKAHASCIAGIQSNHAMSVSHPGTPAPRLPCILCHGK